MLITAYEDWLTEYRNDKHRIWILASTSNGSGYYLREHSEWIELKEVCKTQKLKITSVGLQYRSHSINIDTSDTDGVYLVRSLIGIIGENSKQTITIGKLYGDVIHKTMWVTPELVEDLTSKDNIEDCFIEALIPNYETETRTV